KLAARVDEITVELMSPVLGAADAGLHDLQLRIDALDQARREAHEIGPDGLPRPQREQRPGTA
ncbi:MAG TPA: hypothetical protein VEO00_02260, partial [Actinomycetota bacterium]|nr:hypothetical protein [Actinomycetota bacterium]